MATGSLTRGAERNSIEISGGLQGDFFELERRSKEVTESSTGIFRYGPLWFFSYIFSHLSYFSCLFSMISSLLVGLLHFDDLLV